MINFFKKKEGDFKSSSYWENRYKTGGNSGSGSYKKLAEFKAEVINNLVSSSQSVKVVEFGCGDGNQLSQLLLKKYIGLDVSPTIIQSCKKRFINDSSKSFFLYDTLCFVDNSSIFSCDCSMSIDVLFHLVEQEIYETYLEHLFTSASKMVIIYAADMDIEQRTKHEKYRKFTKDIEKKFPNWMLKEVIKNKYPAKNYEDEQGSLADFFIYVSNS